jgi:murein DD-endopeptidase MepM/ murein hydrolase activator NlpD
MGLCLALVAVAQAQGGPGGADSAGAPEEARPHMRALLQARAELSLIPDFRPEEKQRARLRLRLLEAAWSRMQRPDAPRVAAQGEPAAQEPTAVASASVVPVTPRPASRGAASLRPARDALWAGVERGRQRLKAGAAALVTKPEATGPEVNGPEVSVAAPGGQEAAPREAAPPEGLALDKGQLQPPLLYGQVKVPFGTARSLHSRTLLRHTGWTLAAPSGHRVRNISQGRVVYAGALRGYGLAVVVDHGHQYHSVYAHMRVLLVKVGDGVKQGDPLGVLGATGSIGGERLYFELRHRGRPLDPEGWFAPPGRFR